MRNFALEKCIALRYHEIIGNKNRCGLLLALQAIVINRLAGIPYPLWNPNREPEEESKRTEEKLKSR